MRSWPHRAARGRGDPLESAGDAVRRCAGRARQGRAGTRSSQACRERQRRAQAERLDAGAPWRPLPMRTSVATAGRPLQTDRPIVVASKPFGESYLLCEMFAQLLESHGFRVERRPGLGATEVAFAALRAERDRCLSGNTQAPVSSRC